jgi:hypothetical protein
MGSNAPIYALHNVAGGERVPPTGIPDYGSDLHYKERKI